jgi:hypothetical protein
MTRSSLSIIALGILTTACGSGAAPERRDGGDDSLSPSIDASAATAHDAGDVSLVNVGAGPWSITTARTVPTPTDDLTVFAFSQVGTNESDPQVLALAPDIVMRAWQAWDGVGTKASDYDFTYTAACQAAGIRFIGGTTATAMFKEQWASAAEFEAMATRDASGALVAHEVVGHHRRI